MNAREQNKAPNRLNTKAPDMTPIMHLCLLLAATSIALADNPVKAPIIKNDLDVHVSRYAKIPNEPTGEKARIICIIPHKGSIYVCTLTKIYKVLPNKKVSTYIDVQAAIATATDRKLSTFNKQHGGVRSIAFHPSFNSNGLLYISCMEDRPKGGGTFKYISDVSNPIAADSVLLEFKESPTTKTPVASSYRNVFRVGMPVFDHTIRQMAFLGPLLYIAHGDGSVQSAIAGGGQKNDALGKILRINPLQSGSAPYTVPASNPFVNSAAMKSEVWALGFRNPHHMCFGKDGTLYSADTGRSNVEEVNLVKGGKNYGWSKREGTFVHTGGGLISGVKNLPANDAQNGFEYPNAQVGHDGPFGAGFIGQAIAGGCPVENGSPMSGNYYYADFPETGNLYFSKISELKGAKTNGPPGTLTQAKTRQANIWFDHDNNAGTPPLKFNSLGEAMRSEGAFSGSKRVDVRFGKGPKGELYWSSKISGQVYLFTSSLPGGPIGPP